MWYKRLGFAGAARWRLLYWVYKLWPGLHIRHKEWDWILEFLPPLMKGQEVRVLDVGCTSSLFVYELVRRGYDVKGSDIRAYQEKPKGFKFLLSDITKYHLSGMMDFVVCISVLEHIQKSKQADAVANMVRCLQPGGRLLLTIPTKEYSQGHEWDGFDTADVIGLIQKPGHAIERTERAGQMCLVIERIRGWNGVTPSSIGIVKH